MLCQRGNVFRVFRKIGKTIRKPRCDTTDLRESPVLYHRGKILVGRSHEADVHTLSERSPSHALKHTFLQHA
jgi:hypothetical protein